MTPEAMESFGYVFRGVVAGYMVVLNLILRNIDTFLHDSLHFHLQGSSCLTSSQALLVCLLDGSHSDWGEMASHFTEILMSTLNIHSSNC